MGKGCDEILLARESVLMHTLAEAIDAGNQYQKLRRQWLDRKKVVGRECVSAQLEYEVAYARVKRTAIGCGETGVSADTKASEETAELKEAYLLLKVDLEDCKDEIAWCNAGLDWSRSVTSGIKEEMGLAR